MTDKQANDSEGAYISLDDLRRADFEDRLEAWRQCGTPLYEMAAKEIDTLRSLVDEQLQAMEATPASDMNHAGLRWRQRARELRGLDHARNRS